ncbi:MAG: hypothetical protein Q4C61_04745 [Lachnospiraceae bacterium]|nr:hypothetical protein [Lachnospiraceae bacterium]
MSEKQRKGRRAYLNDIKMNESGKYVYEGTYYAWDEKEKGRRRILAKLWGVCAVLAAAAVAAGCIPAPGMENCVYLVLPYALQVIAAVSVCWGLGRLSLGGNPLREYVYQAAVEKLPGRAVISAVFAGLTAAGELVYVIQNGVQGEAGMFALCLVLEAIVTAAALYLRFAVLKLSWEKQSRRTDKNR